MEPNGSMTRRPRRPAARPSARLRLLDLEERLTPATFNIPNGDTLALIAAITASNTDNQPDTINLPSVGTYTFTNFAAGETITLKYDYTDSSSLPGACTFCVSPTQSITVSTSGACP